MSIILPRPNPVNPQIQHILILTSAITHIPHPKLSQREITEIKNPSEHKNKHIEKKRDLRNSK
ncbi:MAG: hypothetical protein ACK53Q_21705, partial [Dolichospermum sp.]